MKKYAKLITAILLVSLLALSLFACFDPSNDTQGTMTLVLLDGDDAEEFVVDLSKIPSGNSAKGLMAVLDYLQDQGQLTYTSQPSSYGVYLTRVGSLVDGNDGYYLSIYTDVESDISVAEWATTITYKDATCTSSDFNASQMSVKDGCTIIITLIFYGFFD